MKNLLFVIVLLFSLCLSAQERQLLHGRVVPDGGGVGISNLFVINTTAGLETKTDANGGFEIMAKRGDVLVVYSTMTAVREFRVSDSFFKEKPLILSVSFVYELEEIVIESYRDITPESLGLVPKGQKRYTPAEKKLFTATNGLGIGTIVALDPIINAISGKTRTLKQAVQTERKEMLREKIYEIVTEEEIREKYKIPAEYVRGFVFYCVEDKALAAAVRDDNETLAKFLMTGLAERYLKLISNDG